MIAVSADPNAPNGSSFGESMAVIDGPARLHAGHVQDRGLSVVAGTSRAWRNRDESALAAYASRGMLQGGLYTTSERESAGDHYRHLWEIVGKSTRDSTQLEIVQSGSNAPLAEGMADASRELIHVELRLSRNDRRILRRVCWENWWPAQAVCEVDPKYEHVVAPRFREALDSLIVAISQAKS